MLDGIQKVLSRPKGMIRLIIPGILATVSTIATATTATEKFSQYVQIAQIVNDFSKR